MKRCRKEEWLSGGGVDAVDDKVRREEEEDAGCSADKLQKVVEEEGGADDKLQKVVEEEAVDDNLQKGEEEKADDNNL